MTREEAIKELDTIPTIGEQVDALEIAIEALEREPCEDAISRTELLSRIDAERKHLLDLKMDGAEHIIVHHARRIIEETPPVTPQPKVGEWLADVDRWGDIVTTTDGYRCSECNAFNTDKDNYCSNCGAKMEVEE